MRTAITLLAVTMLTGCTQQKYAAKSVSWQPDECRAAIEAAHPEIVGVDPVRTARSYYVTQWAEPRFVSAVTPDATGTVRAVVQYVESAHAGGALAKVDPELVIEIRRYRPAFLVNLWHTLFWRYGLQHDVDANGCDGWYIHQQVPTQVEIEARFDAAFPDASWTSDPPTIYTRLEADVLRQGESNGTIQQYLWDGLQPVATTPAIDPVQVLMDAWPVNLDGYAAIQRLVADGG
jgi:hypothetical protein